VVVAGLPQVVSAPATNIQTLSATLGGEVLSTGGITTSVVIYYGTSDGGTNTCAWAQNVALGPQTGGFSQNVALAANTTYFFTGQASKAVGVAWATPSRSFNTAPVMLAQLTNAPATAISASGATLNGEVLSTGGEAPAVTLYYGQADGGTNAGAW